MAKSLIDNQNQTRPWVRYWARSFDFALYYLITLLVLFPLITGAGWGLFFTPIYLIVMMVVFFLAIFIEAIMLSWWGTTPGKWMLRVQLRHETGEKLSYSQALKRSGDVWFRALALGLPLINVVTLIYAFFFLKRTGQTSWDRDGRLTVSHQPISVERWLTTLLVVMALPVCEFLINLFYATLTVVVMGVLTLTGVICITLFQWVMGWIEQTGGGAGLA